jgi:hypothetical protein
MLVAILLTVLAGADLQPGVGEVVPDPRSTLVPSGLALGFGARRG